MPTKSPNRCARSLFSRLQHQAPKRSGKIDALQQPEGDRISKRKARVRYEFGRKFSIATSLDAGFIFEREQVEMLTNHRSPFAVVDGGCCGHGEDKIRVRFTLFRPNEIAPQTARSTPRPSHPDHPLNHRD
jgi:IS5 family transposase